MFNGERIRSIEKELGLSWEPWMECHISVLAQGLLRELRDENRVLRDALAMLAKELGYEVNYASPKLTVTKIKKPRK